MLASLAAAAVDGSSMTFKILTALSSQETHCLHVRPEPRRLQQTSPPPTHARTVAACYVCARAPSWCCGA